MLCDIVTVKKPVKCERSIRGSALVHIRCDTLVQRTVSTWITLVLSYLKIHLSMPKWEAWQFWPLRLTVTVIALIFVCDSSARQFHQSKHVCQSDHILYGIIWLFRANLGLINLNMYAKLFLKFNLFNKTFYSSQTTLIIIFIFWIIKLILEQHPVLSRLTFVIWKYVNSFWCYDTGTPNLDTRRTHAQTPNIQVTLMTI